MRKLKKITLGLLILIVVVLVFGGVFVNQIARKAIPDYNRSASLRGLEQEVRIYRDHNAIPHIYAKSENDLYIAVGYVMAQDRLWQMDLLRRVTLGRLSEVLGERMVGADHLLRALRIPEKSALVLSQMEPEQKLAIEAFCLGVNQYIEMHQKTLPPEFSILGYKPELWEPFHSVNLIGYMAWDLSGSWGPEIVLYKLKELLDKEKFQELLPDMDYHRTYVYPEKEQAMPETAFSLLEHSAKLSEMGLEVFNGSNSWAVSGSRTKTGAPLFANDMHLAFGAPGIWYQMHQVVEGSLNVRGVVLPGQPLIVVGHNENIAWGMTNLYVDDIDFYLETVDPEKPGHYLFDGTWKEMEVRQEKIAVKGGDTLLRENRFTHRGPVISGFKNISDQVISMRWTGNEFSNELRSIYLLNRAGNWDEFRDALSTMTSVSQNVTYADIQGNIGQQTAGGVPLRYGGEGVFVFPGDTSLYDWTGMLPFDALPYVYNPPEGYVSSANNRTVGDNYPHYIGHWYDTSNRIDRIREMLDSRELVDAGYFMEMMNDAKSRLAERVTGSMVEVIGRAENLNDNERAALAGLGSWDYVMGPGSMAAAVFEKFYNVFMKHILQDDMGEELYRQFGGPLIRNMFDNVFRNPESKWLDNDRAVARERFEEVVVRSFRESVAWLEENLGRDPKEWQWGRLHQLTISHPLASVAILDRFFGLSRGPFPVGGSFHTINNYAYGFHNPFEAVHGASQRHIFNLDDWSDNHMIVPTGVSGIPASRYFLNQTADFVNNEYYRLGWTRDEIVSGAKYTAIFVPAR